MAQEYDKNGAIFLYGAYRDVKFEKALNRQSHGYERPFFGKLH